MPRREPPPEPRAKRTETRWIAPDCPSDATAGLPPINGGNATSADAALREEGELLGAYTVLATRYVALLECVIAAAKRAAKPPKGLKP
jgi:hypothetical protein